LYDLRGMSRWASFGPENSKREIRNPKQIPMTEIPNQLLRCGHRRSVNVKQLVTG
jgi:hypothetical protein